MVYACKARDRAGDLPRFLLVLQAQVHSTVDALRLAYMGTDPNRITDLPGPWITTLPDVLDVLKRHPEQYG